MSGRTRSYAIRRIRLVNFHNFVDETIEIHEGGHLFLLGDNGSGKTTVLDAIHAALTGALDMELNAAARIAGGREQGRRLQGIALRLDTERGVQREGGAIAYSVVELYDAEQQAALCAGVGIEATTMDADVKRWAILHAGPLESVPLVEDGPDGRVPATRDGLRAALGKLDVFATMSEYRRALGERLFGGAALYEEVCRFWTMAKAYREIVTRARDFAGLFARLLPAPEAQLFDDILKSLRALDELDGLVADLDKQQTYVSGVAALVEEIRTRREEIARYAWLLAFRRRGEAVAEVARLVELAADRAAEVQRREARVEVERGKVAVAQEAIRAADARDPEGLVGRLRDTEARLGESHGDVATSKARLDDAERELSHVLHNVATAQEALGLECSDRVETLRAAATGARTLAHPIPLVLEVVEADRADVAARGPLPAVDPRAHEEAQALLAAADRELRQREREVTLRDHDLLARQAELHALSTDAEESPAVAGFPAARAALAKSGIEATPLFELLDPAAGASESDIAAIEALVGDPALAAFVVAETDLDAARARALPHAGARVIARTAADAPPPAWVLAVLGSSTPPRALAALGTLLSQAPSLGAVAAPDALGDVEHRGAATRPGGGPRLIGAEARRRARAARVAEARRAVEEAELALKQSKRLRDAAERARELAASVGRALAELRGARVRDAHATLERALYAHDHAVLDVARTREDHSKHAAREKELATLVDALRARMREAGLDEVERHLAALRKRLEEADALLGEAQQACAHAVAGKNATERDRATAQQTLEGLAVDLATRASALRTALGKDDTELDDAALERYVRVERRGDQFKTADNIEVASREADRQEAAACREIEGDGARGTRNVHYAARFGFAWSSTPLSVEDRRGAPIASVLAELERTIAEQREVVSERTRDLMEKLVMGDLARELQEQVEQLYRTVREMNRLLEDLRFGITRYQFRITPKSDVVELVSVVRKLSLLDEASRKRFREIVDARLEDVRRLDRDDGIPELLDYRLWFDYRLTMRSAGDGDTELTRELRALGSGGEQGVPNYLLVLALAKLMFDNAEARVRPLLFDEAFYGIDAGRRDQLLRFATELGLQLVVASPDQDGVTPSARRTTTLFVVKDEHGDVHLAPYHYWNDTDVAQTTLFPERAAEPDPSEAVCATSVGATES